MAHRILAKRPGGPEVLEYESYEPAAPGPGEALVRQAAIGLNFIDVYHRTGLYPVNPPFTPGLEGAGTVEAVGPDVTDLAPGQRLLDHLRRTVADAVEVGERVGRGAGCGTGRGAGSGGRRWRGAGRRG